MNNPIYQKLPAGLMDDDVELFVHGSENYFLQNGKVAELVDAPQDIKSIILDDLASRPDAVRALHILGITDPILQMLLYARCVCGGFQGTADISGGKLHHTEYWDCGQRGNCKHEGKLCCSITINETTRLTEREIELGKWICTGLPDKILSDKMKIAESTVNIMKRNICVKIGGTTKLDIMNFFMKHNFQQY